MDIPTKQYIRQIQSIFKEVIKHYKSNVRTNKEINPEEIKKLEQLTDYNFPPDLKCFLEWSGVMPIWKAPFMPFINSGKDFYLWSNQLSIVKVKLTSPHYHKKMELMFGDFFDQNNEKYAFHLCFDYNGEVTGKKYAIFIEYGKEKIKHKWVIEDKSDIFILAENINQFLIKYLTYLKSLPIPNPKYPKIDKLLNNHKKLYDYVAKYNWDDGIEEMEYIVKNNNCDKATALLIYWLCIPYYFDDRTGKELKLLPYIIEENFTNNYYQNSENKFDPENNQLENFIKSYKQSKDCVRTLPNHMVKMKV